MSGQAKIFEYQENGLSYTVTVYERDGEFFADVMVNEGAMDVNAIYFGDDDMSGQSASLKGPLTMNGGGTEYNDEAVQWDEAIKLSDPGLGKEGAEKETFVSEGDTLTISLPISSLDDIEFFGIRATSTTTDEGSIKGVSGDPETPDDPEDPTYDKVFFDYGVDDSGSSNGGVFILAEEPENNEFNVPALPEGTEPTFDNYLAYLEELGGDVTQVDSVALYESDEDGTLRETVRFDAPEGGFADADAVLNGYDDAIDDGEAKEASELSGADDDAVDGSGVPIEGTEADDTEALALMEALSFNADFHEEPFLEDSDELDDMAFA